MNASYNWVVLLTAIAVFQAASNPVVDQTAPPALRFAVGPRYIRLPADYFVLVRKGNSLGAFRLSRIHQDEKGVGESMYDSYFQENGQAALTLPNATHRQGAIEIKPMKGIHAFAWQSGQNKLTVGPWQFGCLSPTLVNMSRGFSEKDEGYEFAPTSAKSLSELNPSDVQLRWFRLDSGKRIEVSISDLSK